MKRYSKQHYFIGFLFLLISLMASCAKNNSAPATNTNAATATLEFTIYDGSGTYRALSPYAAVQLFKTNDDRINKTNPVTGLLTSNSKAVVTINNLQAINYFFNAYSADMTKSNATTFNQTNPLTAGAVTKLSPVVK